MKSLEGATVLIVLALGLFVAGFLALEALCTGLASPGPCDPGP